MLPGADGRITPGTTRRQIARALRGGNSDDLLIQ